MTAPVRRLLSCFCSLFEAKASIVLAIIGLLSLACPPYAAGQANVQGLWQTLPNTMPINPVHAALLHNGKVLIVSGSGNLPTETNWRAAIFDPATGSVTIQPVGWDMFCNGMIVLADGRAFVNGGTLQYDPFHGELRSAIYDPATGQFTDVQTMAHGRWYPTVTNLSDGTLMTFSGLDENSNTNSTVEIYTVGSGWSTTYGSPFTPALYPRLHLIPNGKVFYSGATARSYYFDPSAHTWSGVVATTKLGTTRTYGTSVLLPLTPANNYKPVVMIMGGGNPATSTTELIDLSAASPGWVSGPAMSQPRIEMNATILPNGRVIALGGSLNDEDTTTASLKADLYNPATNQFDSAGQNVYARLYHSNSLLLPDATVLVIGGNPARGTYEAHMEIYSPPYLFNSDGTAATRPSITSVPTTGIGYGGGFQVQTPDAQNISSVVLMRPGAPTHAFDMEQRMVGLSFTAGAGVLNVTAPPNGNIAPPGYYLLFILNSSGVPSVGKFVLLTRTPSDLPPNGTITSPTTNVTINAGQSVSFAGTGSDPDGTITGYSWIFAGGNPSTSPLATPGNVTYASPGTFTATLTVTDNAGVTDPTPPTRTITVTATQAPAITSASSTTFSVGTAGLFNVTTTGAPTPTITETGTLPNGVTFTDNGNGTATLGGTPAVGTVGVYPITLKAHNGVGTDASQNFTLTVNGGGSGSSNFAYVNGSVTGVFNPNGNASTTLSVGLHQNPGAGHLLLCAATWQSSTATASINDPNNGAWKAAGSAKPGTGSLTGYSGQIFYVPAAQSAPTTVTLTLSAAVGFRSLECAEYSYTGSISSPDGTPQYSTVPASGGVATVAGLTTSNSSDLVFAACLGVDSTCAAGTGYTLRDDTNSLNVGNGKLGNSFLAKTGQTIEEKVGVAAGAQSATFKTGTNDNVILGLIAIQAAPPAPVPPAITSANSATFIVGSAGTFTATATGVPTPALTETGALPNGVNFKDNGNGTATLSGTPAAGTAGTYPITITANNGVGTAANQNFTLTVNQAAAITSPSATTFAVGTAGTFGVTTTGAPTPALTETGALPNGVTFKDNGNGTATLSGTPAAGTGGSYAITITANNGVGAPANQNFTLTVNQAAAITSASTTTFNVGAAGTFSVTTTGVPKPTLTETGALPNGVTFKDNANGTATLSGTPAAGTAGSYPITITANNGVGAPANQNFTLTVSAATQAPAITSASSATFSVGTAGTFSVTTTGAPTPTITETGTLPNGVTFTDNGNGTATLGGTPAVGTVGVYPITLKAHNGVGTDASQNFTLTVNGGGSGSSNFAYVNGSVTGVFNPSGSASTTLSVGLHQNPGAGHLLLCAATWQSQTATASVNDPNNGAWKAAGSAKPGTGSLAGYSGQIFYVPAAQSAPTTVTLTISTAVVFRSLECAEYSYTGSISSPDGTPQYSTVPASGGVATVGGLTTSNSSDLVFAACLGVDSSCAAGTGYTLHDDTNSLDAGNGTLGNSFLAHTGQSIEEKVGVAAGAQTATFKTGTNTDNVILGLLAF